MDDGEVRQDAALGVKGEAITALARDESEDVSGDHTLQPGRSFGAGHLEDARIKKDSERRRNGHEANSKFRKAETSRSVGARESAEEALYYGRLGAALLKVDCLARAVPAPCRRTETMMGAHEDTLLKTLSDEPNGAFELSHGLARLRAGLSSVIRGQDEAVERLMIGLVAGGHVLVEDVPGVGKTTLAKALARGLHMSFSRVQCTPDLLPSDILGSSVLDPRDGSLTFRPGPIFANVVLVDETNRASPRTQSGLLEAMNEGQVTVDGSTRPLPDPFFVVATQNPVDFQGTFPLPAAQLDRFLLRLRLGYPSELDELEILSARRLGDPLSSVQVALSTADVISAQAAVKRVTVVDGVAKYLLGLARATRSHTDVELGTSTRGALGLYRASQARAFLRGRDYVSPDDVLAMAEPVLAHRLVLTGAARYAGRSPTDVIRELLDRVPVPM